MRTVVATVAVAALLLVPAPAHAAARAGDIALVDVAPDGSPGNGYNANEALSNDGRVVAFASNSTNLVSTDINGTYQVFVRDLATGTTTLASTGPGGQPENDYPEAPVISGNGRYVAFTSYATNLTADDTNGQRDVFVHDRQTGVTTRASVLTGNVQLDGYQYDASISDNGRYVTFIDNDIIHGNGEQVYVHDMKTGVTKPLALGWTGSSDQYVFKAAISGNGKRVVFAGTGDFAGDGGSVSGVWMYDLTTGVTVRVSPQAAGGAPVDASTPATDRAGTRVVYQSNGAIDPSDTNQRYDFYADDLTTGATTLVSANHAGTGAGNADTSFGSLSANGRYAGFFSTASDLVAHDTNGNDSDVFLRDLKTGRTTLVTASPTGGSGDGPSWGGIPSANGSRVLFDSVATNLGVDPGDGQDHIYVRCLRNC